MSNRDDHSSDREADVFWLDDPGSGRGAPPHGHEQVLSIGNVARMFGVPRWMLRYYELRGLIERRHRQEHIWVYGWADCERLSFIIKCRKAGLALRDVIAIIDATDDDAPAAVSKRGQELCMAQVDRLERRRKLLDEALAELSHVYALLTAKIVGHDLTRRD